LQRMAHQIAFSSCGFLFSCHRHFCVLFFSVFCRRRMQPAHVSAFPSHIYSSAAGAQMRWPVFLLALDIAQIALNKKRELLNFELNSSVRESSRNVSSNPFHNHHLFVICPRS
jgi:hypothetical protein